MSNGSRNVHAPRPSRSVWWKQFEERLKEKGLPPSCFEIARGYYEMGLTPEQAAAHEAEVELRLAA